jgi:hypothetical protein
MFPVCKFIFDLAYDGVLSFGTLYIIKRGIGLLQYFIQTQHEETMTRLNNEFYKQQDGLLK